MGKSCLTANQSGCQAGMAESVAASCATLVWSGCHIPISEATQQTFGMMHNEREPGSSWAVYLFAIGQVGSVTH